MLARVACPALLIRATQLFGSPGFGPILTAQSAQQTIALMHQARLVDVEGNHITMLFHPHAERVTAEVTRFILEPRD